MLQFWFETGLRPGELQALQWSHIDWDRAIAHIELNQVAEVIKGPRQQQAFGMSSCPLMPWQLYTPSARCLK